MVFKLKRLVMFINKVNFVFCLENKEKVTSLDVTLGNAGPKTVTAGNGDPKTVTGHDQNFNCTV